jgi:hypothetical protein
MPRLTRWYLRAAMLHLGGALVLGLLHQVPGARSSFPFVAVLFPTLLHLLVVGWITQVIFGVAYWMFPRYSAEQPRGSERLGWITLVTLNAGMLLRLVGEPAHLLGRDIKGLLVTSALLQLVAGWAFILNTWPRLRER